MNNEDRSFILLEDAALDLQLLEAELVSTLRRNGMRLWVDFPIEDANRNGIGNWEGRLYFGNVQLGDDRYACTPGTYPLEEKSMITLQNAIEQGKRAGERLMDLEIETPPVKQWERMFEGSNPRLRLNDPKLATSSRLPTLVVLDSDLKKLLLSLGQKESAPAKTKSRRSNVPEQNAYQQLLERTTRALYAEGKSLPMQKVIHSLKHHLEEGDTVEIKGGQIRLAIAAGTKNEEVITRTVGTFAKDLSLYRQKLT